eukprot:g3531.t1
MTHILREVERVGSKLHKKEACEAVTLLECPPLMVIGVVGYIKTAHGLKTKYTVWAQHLAETYKRKFYSDWYKSKKKAFDKFTKNMYDNNAKAITEILEKMTKECAVIRLLAHTQITKIPLSQKRAHTIEIQINGGNIAEKVDFAYKLFEKEIPIKSIFSEGELIDCISVSKGRGREGVITRWGVTRLPRKTHRGLRKVACIGAWHPARVSWTVARAGQNGFHHRTQINNKVYKVGEKGTDGHTGSTEFDVTDKGLTPMGGFVRYGMVKEDYLMIKGAIVGTKKRPITLRKSLMSQTSRRALEAVNLKFIDTSAKFGHGRFQTADEKMKFLGRIKEKPFVMESPTAQAEPTEGTPSGLNIKTRDQNVKQDTPVPQSPGTARITAFYPGPVAFPPNLRTPPPDYSPYLTTGVVPAQQFNSIVPSPQQTGYPPYAAATLFPTYSYDASMALAALAIGEARARLQYSLQPNHFATAPSTPLTRSQDSGVFTRTGRNRGGIGKSRSDVSSWRKDEGSSALLRSSTVPHPTGSLTFLERFKTVGGRGFTLESVKGNIASLALDQTGSRWLQTQLEEYGSSAGNKIFREILQNALLLSRDIFGNYVIQKTFLHIDQRNKDALGGALKGRMRRLSFDVYGCRVVQQAIEHVNSKLAVELALELEEVILHCVVDANGNHVLQRCIECLPTERIACLIEPLLGHFQEIAEDQYGCRVVQRIIEYCSVKEIRDSVLDEVIASISNLASTEYGNYVVQHVAEHGGPKHREKALHRIGTNFRFLSHQKFSSRVVEKFLEFANVEELQYIIQSMFPRSEDGFTEEDWVVDMMIDPFANYVLQKIFEVASRETTRMFASVIIANRKQLLANNYGKNVVDAAVNEGIVKATELTLPMLSSDASSTVTD